LIAQTNKAEVHSNFCPALAAIQSTSQILINSHKNNDLTMDFGKEKRQLKGITESQKPLAL
jgi:hypothetical protein